VIIHLDINIFAPDSFDYAKRETLPPLTVFNPSRLNTDQRLAAARGAGAKYAVLVAKHGTGFCLWPSHVHGYHVGNTPWQGGNGDIVRDFIASCKKYGIRPGLYYNTKVLQQLTELWTSYGELFEIWFDGSVMADRRVFLFARRISHEPSSLLLHRTSALPVLCIVRYHRTWHDRCQSTCLQGVERSQDWKVLSIASDTSFSSTTVFVGQVPLIE
jgi:alpha-L-fucosidase